MEDTRGWRPREIPNGATIEDSRTGVHRHDTKVASVNYPSGLGRQEPKGAELDNMGNSHANRGPHTHPFESAETTDNAPSVPLSSYEGADGVSESGGVKLDGGYKVQLHDAELRPQGRLGPASSAVIHEGAITSSSPQWRRAVIPGGNFGNMTSDEFMGETHNVESMQDATAIKEEGGFRSTVQNRGAGKWIK
jgi:hypothetical protein